MSGLSRVAGKLNFSDSGAFGRPSWQGNSLLVTSLYGLWHHSPATIMTYLALFDINSTMLCLLLAASCLLQFAGKFTYSYFRGSVSPIPYLFTALLVMSRHRAAGGCLDSNWTQIQCCQEAEVQLCQGVFTTAMNVNASFLKEKIRSKSSLYINGLLE